MNPRIFNEQEAEHYCATFNNSLNCNSISIDDFRSSNLQSQTSLLEGTALFDNYRDCSLQEIERLLFLAASNYRRCFDLMIPSSSYWAYVTIYYGIFYAAKAFLGMFGCTIFKDHVIDVEKGNPGKQELIKRKIGNSTNQIPTNYSRSSHKIFWDFFYRSVNQLSSVVDAKLSPALMPIKNNPIWLIEERNKINYQSTRSFEEIKDFQQSFSSSSFPYCLKGSFATQFEIFELLLELTFSYAKQFHILTNAIDIKSINASTSLEQKIDKLIFRENIPNISQKRIEHILTST